MKRLSSVFPLVTISLSALGLAACGRANAPSEAAPSIAPPAAAAATTTPAATAPVSTAPVPDVVFVPTPFRVVDVMLAVARVQPGDVLFDLGSGDGRIVIAAAKRFGVKATGIDIDPVRIKESRENADTAGVTRLVEFREADLFTTDLRSASVVTLYLLPRLNVRLRPKLFAELRPGSRIVSHSFDMGDWKPDSTLSAGPSAVYYWVMPANVAGRWAVTASVGGNERRHDIGISQTYQELVITAASGGPVSGAAIRGDSIRFVLGNATFRGRVSGDSMNGAVSAGGASGTWRASRTRP